MSEDKGLVPELRFPEFVGDGEWEEKQLVEIASFFKGKGLPKSEIKINGKFPCIHYGELFTEYSEVIHRVKSKTNLIDCFYSLNNDVLMPTSDVTPNGLAKASCIKLDKVILGGDILIIRTEPQIIHGEFLSRYIRKSERDVLKLVSGSTVYHLYSSSLGKLMIALPPQFLEQQKIASCLSSLDDLIAAHSQKLDLLKEHKKGLMQNLFPQEGETLPKIRFPEFVEDGDWVERTLGDEEISILINKKISVQKLILDSYISTENMLSDFSGVTKSSKLPPSGNFTNFIENDILISNIRPYLKKVWKSNKSGGASNDILVFRAGASVLSGYLEFILKNDTFIDYVMKGVKGVKMPRGDKDTILEYPLKIPSIKEQQKIAGCLSELDELIIAQASKIAQLQLHKKGLMQGLFPKVG